MLLPRVCTGCGRRCPDDPVCVDCSRELLKLIAQPWCPRCGSTLGKNIPASDEGCVFCPNPLGRFEQVIRLGSYTGVLRRVIRECKFHRQLGVLDRLIDWLTQAVVSRCDTRDFDIVIPVPMHWRERIWRNQNFARMIATGVAKQLGVALGHELVRVKHVPRQALLSRTMRIKNLQGAFGVRGGSTVSGARILLIDDVTTTGTTANESAKALLHAGATKITLAVLAKTDRHRVIDPTPENAALP